MECMKEQWSDLSPGVRRAIIVVATLDVAARAIALNDLRKRSAHEIRGKKAAWGWALALVDSAGVLPLVYFARGRRGPAEIDA